MNDKFISAPIPTLKRLPKYLQILKRLRKNNIEYVSATRIAEELKIDAIQVRKDIQSTGIIGKPKIGFELNELIERITSFLNWDNTSDAFIVGVGSLGQAILGYKSFKNHGLNIIAGFDVDESKIGSKIHGIEIYSLDKMPNLIKRLHINVGVITAPAQNAQTIADMMLNAGIISIWNFAPANIHVPDGIILENVSLTQSLAVLTHKLSEKNKRS